MTSKTYRISENFIENVEKKIDQFNRRCDRLGLPQITIKILSTEPVQIKSKPAPVYVNFHEVEITGETPMMGDYKLVAVLEHDIPGEFNIVRVVPGMVLPIGYRTAPANCDHCHQIRNRKETYVLQDIDGNHTQIGSGCIQDFTGQNDPHAVAEFAQMLVDLGDYIDDQTEEGDNDFEFGRTGRSLVKVVDFLAFAVMVVEKHGWLSKTQAMMISKPSTSDLALNWYADGKVEITPEANQKALDIIEAVKNDLATSTQDYEYNLYCLANVEFMKYHHTGLVASMVSWYQRLQSKRVVDQSSTSQHMGTIGKREVFTLTVKSISEKEGQYGITYITNLVDANNNLFVWFASKELIVDETYTGKATVKDHTIYNHRNQTVITRFDAK